MFFFFGGGGNYESFVVATHLLLHNTSEASDKFKGAPGTCEERCMQCYIWGSIGDQKNAEVCSL